MKALLLSLVLVPTTLQAQAAPEYNWPREIQTPKGRIVLYQPQPEKLTGNHLTGRAAISLTPTGAKDPIFGAMWMTATVDTDRDKDLAVLRELKVTRVRWPDATAAQQQTFTQLVEADFPKQISISLARLSASLATADKEQASLEGIKNDPPKIIFIKQMAVLLLYDGEPQVRGIDNTPLERVINTPYAVVREKSSPTWYLGAGGKLWYSASDVKGPWKPGATPPAEITKRVPPDTSKKKPPKEPPAIVVATEPTELVVTSGEPKWKPLPDGSVLYVENTETPLLREVEGQDYYILLAGRWFRSRSFEGPWTFVRGDQLPKSFSQIPPDSPIGNVRVSVAGTEEAEDALLEMQIPQTAAIKRSTAKLEVKYDGNPKFKEIEGTKVAYAENTSSQVLRIDNVYYACDNAVWFTSKNATGPWVVADSIPRDEIKKIPASSPAYNTTYVQVYESTPEVVYVGYTSGYTYAYPYYGVPIYGTGWYYPPYIMGPIYYPHPVTFGFHVSYSPYGGWGFGFSWGTPYMSFGIHFGGGYGGYYPPYGYRPGGCYNCDINIGNDIDIGNRGDRGDRVDHHRRDNVYNNAGVSDRQADRGTRDAASAQVRDRAASGQRNNVYADRDGNVHRRTDNGWETRQGNTWQRSGESATDRSSTQQRPSTNNTQQRPSTTNNNRSSTQQRSYNHSMERDYSARQRGSMRSGGYRGGGGRRR